MDQGSAKVNITLHGKMKIGPMKGQIMYQSMYIKAIKFLFSILKPQIKYITLLNPFLY